MGQRNAGVAKLQLAEQQDVDVDRARPVARTAGGPPELALQALDGVERPSGSSAVRTRKQALRKLGCSRISPTGSVS